MKHLSLLFVILFAFTTIALADFDVKVYTDSSKIETEAPFGGRTCFIFENGKATISAYSSDSGGIFFALGEEFIAELKRDGYEVYSAPKGHTTTNVGQVYFIVAFNKPDGKVAILFPVIFSPFGVSLHKNETEIYHAGTVYFNMKSIADILKSRKS